MTARRRMRLAGEGAKRAPTKSGASERRSLRIIGISATFVILLAACAEVPPEPEPPRTTVRDSAGVGIAETPGKTWPLDGWSVATIPEVSIGVVDGEEVYQFTRIAGLTRLSDGSIAVLESEAGALRIFSPDGTHLRTIGRPGEGPGEFVRANSLERLQGDTLQVGDMLQRTRFTASGELLAEETFSWDRVRRVGSYSTECGRMPLFLGDDVILCPRRSNDDLPTEGLHRPMVPLVRLSWDLESVDTLGTLLGLESMAIRHAGRTQFVVASLHSRGIRAVDRERARLYLGETGRYEIRVWSLEGGGALERIVRRPGTSRPTRPEDVAEALAGSTRFVRPEIEPSALRGRVVLPDSIVSVHTLVADSEGLLWVGTQDLGPSDGPWYEIFGPDGTLLGGLEMPAFAPWEIGPDYVLGVRWNGLGVPFVELYRLVRGSSPEATRR